jgi:hypothetical protein
MALSVLRGCRRACGLLSLLLVVSHEPSRTSSPRRGDRKGPWCSPSPGRWVLPGHPAVVPGKRHAPRLGAADISGAARRCSESAAARRRPGAGRVFVVVRGLNSYGNVGSSKATRSSVAPRPSISQAATSPASSSPGPARGTVDSRSAEVAAGGRDARQRAFFFYLQKPPTAPLTA